MFAMAAAGKSYEAIAAQLRRDRVPGPFYRYASNFRSGRAPEWTTGSVRVILHNPIYAGDVCWGRRAPGDGD